jgi:hypothetical protein
MKTIIASSIAAGLLVASPIAQAQTSGKIEAVEDGGHEITLEGRRMRLGGERGDDATHITIGGKPGKRRDLKVGMECKAEVGVEAMDRRSRRSAPRASKLACE